MVIIESGFGGWLVWVLQGGFRRFDDGSFEPSLKANYAGPTRLSCTKIEDSS